MAAGQVTFYNRFADWSLSEGVDLDLGTVKMALLGSSYTPNSSTHIVWSGISAYEIAHSSYTAGGIALPNPQVFRSANVGMLLSDDVALVFEDTDSAAKWAVLYVDATIGGFVQPLIGYGDMDSSQTEVAIVAGATLSIPCPVGGWFDWTLTTP